jgi:ribosome-binding protein aMBF1 (putative translation factor)
MSVTATQAKQTKDGGMGRPRSEPDQSTFAGRFGLKIRQRRDALGWSVKELSKKLTDSGMKASPPLIYNWEMGYRLPSIETVPILATVLRLKVSDLFKGE